MDIKIRNKFIEIKNSISDWFADNHVLKTCKVALYKVVDTFEFHFYFRICTFASVVQVLRCLK